MSELPTTENKRKDTLITLDCRKKLFPPGLTQCSSLASQCLCKPKFNVNDLSAGFFPTVGNIFTNKHTLFYPLIQGEPVIVMKAPSVTVGLWSFNQLLFCFLIRICYFISFS